ncbi:MAG: hypothetical protein IKH95_11750 [Bacteroidaceae bacterium]|nr:hypothetical protein [Bacteroidaceae bacterium]
MNLTPIKLQNNEIALKIVDYLNYTPCAITPEIMQDVNPSGLEPERIYQALFSGLLGLNPSNEHDRLLEETYIWKGVHELNPNEFINDPYFQYIQIPSASEKSWHFQLDIYQPYEAFICDDLVIEPDGVEIPQIGFFSQSFRYPAVYEKGQEWMAIKPSEIRSMRKPVSCVSGNVITFGLGLGYYTFMVSQKKEVEHITVVERDSSIIHLFKDYILPQFPHKEKVSIIQSDAFEYMKKQMPKEKYDYAFVDLWHDSSDGLPLYLKARKLAEDIHQTHFLYWVENTLRSAENWNQ